MYLLWNSFKFSALFSRFVFRAAVVPLNSHVVRMFTRDPMLLHRTMRPCTPRGRLTSDSASRLVVPEPVLLRRSPCSGQRVCGARAALDQGRACLSSRSRLALAVFSDERALFLAASCFLELSGLLRSTRCGCCSCAVWEGCTCSLEETASSSRSFYCVSPLFVSNLSGTLRSSDPCCFSPFPDVTHPVEYCRSKLLRNSSVVRFQAAARAQE